MRAENSLRDNPIAFDWLVGLARSLEREIAELRKQLEQAEAQHREDFVQIFGLLESYDVDGAQDYIREAFSPHRRERREGVTEQLLPYQITGAKWLANRKLGLLADEMRLGKTPQAIVAADKINASPILVLCPAIVRMNWSRELAKFSSRSLNAAVLLSGNQIETARDAAFVVCSYDLLKNNRVFALLRSQRWQLVILDEAHYLKSTDAKRTHWVLGKDGIVRQADRVWALTGTPAPNNASEMYPLLRTFGAVTALSYEAFVAEFCTGFNTPYGYKITGTKNADKLREVLKPIMLRRTKKEVRPDLPTARYSDVTVEPGELDIGQLEMAFTSYIGDPRGMKGLDADVALQRKLLEAQFKAATTEDEKLQVLNSAVKQTAMLRRYTGLLKAQAVADLVRYELENGLDKIVLFAIHKAVIEELRERLASFGAVTLYGGTPPAKRERHLESFNNNPKCRVFIGNIAACGVGISLARGASDVLFAESDWVPTNNAQAAARVDDPEQHKAITVRFAALSGSIDEHVTATLRRKTEDLAKIFDLGDGKLPSTC